MSSMTHKVFYFHSDSNWISCQLAEGRSVVCHLGREEGVLLRMRFCDEVPCFLSPHSGVYL